MTRMILRFLNGPGLVLLFTVGMAIQTSLFASYPLNYFQPDVILIATIWLALKRGFMEGGILTLVLADFAEVHSGAPQGFYLITYMTVFLAIIAASKIFLLPHVTSMVTLTMSASAVWKLSGLLLLYLLGIAGNQWRHTLTFLIPGALVEGMLGLGLYQYLAKFDLITYKNIRAQQALEDELQLDGEGL